MAPVEIDGNPITGATIDGTDVQEITVDGDVVFTAVSTVDDFENQNLNIWTGDTGSFAIDTSIVKVGSASSKYTSTNSFDSITTTTGIDGTPDAGDRHQIWMFASTNNDSSPRVAYANDTAGNRYQVGIFTQSNLFVCQLINNSSFGGNLASTSVSLGSQWYLVEMFHDTNGDFEHTLYDSDGTTQLAQITGNDSTHITGGSFNNTGATLQDGTGEASRWDHWIITS